MICTPAAPANAWPEHSLRVPLAMTQAERSKAEAAHAESEEAGKRALEASEERARAQRERIEFEAAAALKESEAKAATELAQKEATLQQAEAHLRLHRSSQTHRGSADLRIHLSSGTLDDTGRIPTNESRRSGAAQGEPGHRNPRLNEASLDGATAVFQNRSDVQCFLHAHTLSTATVASMEGGLPEENTHDAPGKIVQIKCSTRDIAAAAFAPYNDRLYEEIRVGERPDFEPDFEPFHVEASVRCGDDELSMAEMTPEQLASHLQLYRRRAPTDGELSRLIGSGRRRRKSLTSLPRVEPVATWGLNDDDGA